MKTAVIVLALFVAFAAADEECPLMAAMKAGFEKCKDSMNPSQETLELMMKGEGQDNKEVQCFGACVAKEAGVMVGAKMDMEKLESLLKTSNKLNEQQVQEIVAVMKECQAVAEASSDECEVASAYTKCAKSKMPK